VVYFSNDRDRHAAGHILPAGGRTHEEACVHVDDRTIEWVMNLARLSLSGEERAEMSGHLERILSYVDILQELDLSEVEPTAHILGLTNVTRADEPGSSLPVEEVARMAPRWSDGHFEVPRIV
jgi:aspartyl-tRNA(Asn)/glutamyl-tRNA(Gln) amidotransferase subunit C